MFWITPLLDSWQINYHGGLVMRLSRSVRTATDGGRRGKVISGAPAENCLLVVEPDCGHAARLTTFLRALGQTAVLARSTRELQHLLRCKVFHQAVVAADLNWGG